MAGPNENNAAPANGAIERRTHHHLREIFEHAYLLASPLLDSAQNPNASGSAHFVRVVLHDAFPNLHLQDISILSVSIERVYRERSKSIN
ncbi:MAG: hypothetical protein HY799_05565 [Nitrosomonadales bacterium]|nr:hypothetical protein [Nitrosomonadales bacterium]